MTGPTVSLWHDTHSIAPRPALTDELVADVCVVGAGIAGLTVAYTLATAGRKVVVLDLDQVGSGETGRTTGHIANALDDRYEALERARGTGASRMAAEAHTAAIDLIEGIVSAEGIDCDFARVDGWLVLGGDDTRELLEAELAAAHRAGLGDVTLVVSFRVPGGDLGPALRFPRQGRFHALKYLDGLARAVERAGGRIYGASKVTELEGGSPATVGTESGGKVAADDVIVCTNGPISDRVITHAKQAPYRSFVVAYRVPKGTVPDALIWDTPDPYHYVRLHPLDAESDALIVGGEDHKTAHEDDADERFAALDAWTRERFLRGEEASPIAQWSGQVLEPYDYLAYIGRNPDGAEHVWLATGDSGMGITHGTIAGILIPALITKGAHRWEALFDPKRVTLHGTELKSLAREGMDVAIQYGDWVTPGQVGDVADIPAGEGRVIRRGVHKVAAYKAPDGTVHECSAVCTHLKCIVDWNTAEKSWDCPCHGSRFDPMGKVIAGPATFDLPAIDD